MENFMPSVLVKGQAKLGECPLWCPREQALYWTDIDSRQLWRLSQSNGSVRHWDFPYALGSFALCEQPGLLLLGLARGVALFDVERETLGPINEIALGHAAVRLNDGRCDPFGYFVVGAFCGDAPEGTTAGFYRVGPELQIQKLDLPEVVVANSIAFSPDGKIMYFADSPSRRIQKVSYGPDGPVGKSRTFCEFASHDGFPDGSAVDADGFLWTALWAAGCVVRLSAQGIETMRVPLDARYPTCPAFGGAGLNQLFITSARKAVDPLVLAANLNAGNLFTITTPFKGRAEHNFRTTLSPG